MPGRMIAPDALAARALIGEVPPLRRYARVLTGNSERADRLVLETLSRARRKQHRWQRRTSLRAWLFTIMHDLHSDPSRQMWRKLTQTLLNGDGHFVGVSKIRASAVHSDSGSAPVLAHLSRLPVEQREVLLLVAVERLAYAEIATMLRIPVGTVLARLNGAREAMHALTVESLTP